MSISWFNLAREAIGAARTLHREGRHRSATSRAYYAAYAACHAVSLHLGRVTPPDGEPWKHSVIPTVLFDSLRLGLEMRRYEPAVYREHVESLYRSRVIADYFPDKDLEPEVSRKSCRHADRLVDLARRVCT